MQDCSAENLLRRMQVSAHRAGSLSQSSGRTGESRDQEAEAAADGEMQESLRYPLERNLREKVQNP